ncbi:SAM-dependent methyltransferase [Streptomyces sp. MS19]|uniref:SAM-dependent methyltransferase n=1 Tax=Streptomyces sp. MS19 TaxID=3385972 RepID=UPI0039A2AFC3
MAQRRPRSPAALDFTAPSIARMYDFLLDGKDHYEIDRRACWELLAFAPGAKAAALEQRLFRARAVEFLAREAGIDQFIDMGAGLPAPDAVPGNVHEIARRVRPGTRTLYVDDDPVVAAHARTQLDDQAADVVCADFRQIDAVLSHAHRNRLIDLRQPVAVLFVSVLHCLPDRDDPAALIRQLHQRLVPGSGVVISHLVNEDAVAGEEATRLMGQLTGGRWGKVRRRQDVHGFFEDLELVPPGLTDVHLWRGDWSRAENKASGAPWVEYGGVGLVPPRTAAPS